MVGDGSEKARLIELARARGLDNVRFADPIPAAAVLPLYRRAFVGLSTLRDLPIAAAVRPVRAVNAMAAGVPLVYAGSGEGANLVRGAGAGIVTPAGDGQAVAAAIRSCWPIPDERARWASEVEHRAPPDLDRYRPWLPGQSRAPAGVAPRRLRLVDQWPCRQVNPCSFRAGDVSLSRSFDDTDNGTVGNLSPVYDLLSEYRILDQVGLGISAARTIRRSIVDGR